MCIKTTVPVRMVRGLAPLAAATPGCWIMSRTQRVRGTAIVRTPVPVDRRNPKPFTQAVTATATVRGRNTPPPSIGVKAIAGIAVTAAMTTLLIA